MGSKVTLTELGKEPIFFGKKIWNPVIIILLK